MSFPAIWDTPYFDWVLYNASIRQPLARNIVEALGVQAPIDHPTIFADPVVHGVNVDNIAAGQRAMMDMMSPLWPEDILGPIDHALAAQGATVYQGQCAECHAIIDRATHAPPEEAIAGADHRITIPTFPLDAIGTDPRQAMTFATGRSISPRSRMARIAYSSFKAGEAVTGKIVSQWIAQSPENAALAEEVNQGRPNEFRAELRVSRAAAERHLGNGALSPQRLGGEPAGVADAGGAPQQGALHGELGFRPGARRL